jgi:tRNA (cytidine56-2'-O)-methyltransferase
MAVEVLRLGHRPQRDKRITTHCALVARAFGASKMWYSGVKDIVFESSIQKVVEQWGGPFEVEYAKSWRKIMSNFSGKKVHLTMYGEDKRAKGNQLIVIGGEKVPSDVYQLADLNVGIGNQPHSEVAALAIYLNDINGMKKSFNNARIKIEPLKKGKKVLAIPR